MKPPKVILEEIKRRELTPTRYPSKWSKRGNMIESPAHSKTGSLYLLRIWRNRVGKSWHFETFIHQHSMTFYDI